MLSFDQHQDLQSFGYQHSQEDDLSYLHQHQRQNEAMEQDISSLLYQRQYDDDAEVRAGAGPDAVTDADVPEAEEDGLLDSLYYQREPSVVLHNSYKDI